MRITLNGEPVEVPEAMAVGALGAGDGCAIAVNGEVVPRARHDRRLVEGDRVEVVTAVAGG